MAVFIPSFRFQFPEPGLNAPPSGAVAGASAGAALGNLAQGISSAAVQRKQLEAFAQTFDSTDPEIAALLRSQAQSIPLFGDALGTGQAGGRSRSGSGLSSSGVGGEAFTFALRQADAKRRQRERVQIESLSHQNTLERLGVSFSQGIASSSHRAALEERVARTKDLLNETIDDPAARERVERQLRVEEGKLGAENARAGTSQFQTQIDLLRELRQGAETRADGTEFDLTIDPVTGNIIQDPSLRQANQDALTGTNAGVRSKFPGISITDPRTKKKRSEITRQELSDLYVDIDTPLTKKRQILSNIAEHLRRSKELPPIPSNLPEEERTELLNRQLEAAESFILDVPAEGGVGRSTRNFDKALRGLIDIGKKAQTGDNSGPSDALFPKGSADGN